MMGVAGRQDFAVSDRLDRLPDEDAIHDDVAPHGERCSCEFVFCRNVRSQRVCRAGPSDRLTLPQIRKGYQDVVLGTEFEHEFLFDAVA